MNWLPEASKNTLLSFFHTLANRVFARYTCTYYLDFWNSSHLGPKVRASMMPTRFNVPVNMLVTCVSTANAITTSRAESRNSCTTRSFVLHPVHPISCFPLLLATLFVFYCLLKSTLRLLNNLVAKHRFLPSSILTCRHVSASYAKRPELPKARSRLCTFSSSFTAVGSILGTPTTVFV